MVPALLSPLQASYPPQEDAVACPSVYVFGAREVLREPSARAWICRARIAGVPVSAGRTRPGRGGRGKGSGGGFPAPLVPEPCSGRWHLGKRVKRDRCPLSGPHGACRTPRLVPAEDLLESDPQSPPRARSVKSQPRATAKAKPPGAPRPPSSSGQPPKASPATGRLANNKSNHAARDQHGLPRQCEAVCGVRYVPHPSGEEDALPPPLPALVRGKRGLAGISRGARGYRARLAPRDPLRPRPRPGRGPGHEQVSGPPVRPRGASAALPGGPLPSRPSRELRSRA